MNPSVQRRTFWSIAGFALLGLAGWEAVQTSLGRRTANFPRTLAPPVQSRSGERPVLERNSGTNDPVASYLARAKRGMTEQEVRWIVEDFEAAGLAQGEMELADFEAAKKQRQKMEEWYLAALNEGLSLTFEQKEAAKAKLTARFAHDLQHFIKLQESGITWKREHPEAPFCGADTTEAMRRFYYFPATLFFQSEFAPWNLVLLTQQQTSLTLRFWRLEDWKREQADDPFASDEPTEPRYWLYTAKGREMEIDPFAETTQETSSSQNALRAMPGLPAMQDPLTGNLTDFPQHGELQTLRGEDGRRLDVFLPCGNILPLTPDQKSLWEIGYDPVHQAVRCHPAQLRLALLQQPELAKTLREQLDLPPSERGLKLPPKNAAPLSSE